MQNLLSITEKLRRRWLWLPSALLLIGCEAPERVVTLRIIKLPAEQRLAAMSDLPAEKQVDVFLYAQSRVEPPISLAGEVAHNWRSTLPVIRDRLATESREDHLAGLMLALSAISSTFCSVSDRSDVIIAASAAVEKIGPPHRELAEEQLKRVKYPSAVLPPCR